MKTFKDIILIVVASVLFVLTVIASMLAMVFSIITEIFLAIAKKITSDMLELLNGGVSNSKESTSDIKHVK